MSQISNITWILISSAQGTMSGTILSVCSMTQCGPDSNTTPPDSKQFLNIVKNQRIFRDLHSQTNIWFHIIIFRWLITYVLDLVLLTWFIVQTINNRTFSLCYPGVRKILIHLKNIIIVWIQKNNVICFSSSLLLISS